MHVSMNTLILRFKAESQPLAGDLRKTYPHFEELQTHGKANCLKLAAHLQFVRCCLSVISVLTLELLILHLLAIQKSRRVPGPHLSAWLSSAGAAESASLVLNAIHGASIFTYVTR